jgi:hypothetical protein
VRCCPEFCEPGGVQALESELNLSECGWPWGSLGLGLVSEAWAGLADSALGLANFAVTHHNSRVGEKAFASSADTNKAWIK